MSGSGIILDERGFTYIEMIIAIAILAVIITPVMTGFLLISGSYKYARDSYIADLIAENLLIDTGKSIRRNKPGTTDIFPEVEQSADSRYDYIITVNEASGDEWIYKSKPELISSGGAVLEEDTFPCATNELPTSTGLKVLYDNGFTISDGAGGSAYASGDECFIISDGSADIRLDIINCLSEIKLIIDTEYGSNSFIDIYKRADIPDERIKLRYRYNNGAVIVRFLDEDVSVNKSYIITAEIFDKDTRLIKKLADRIILPE